MWKIAFIRSQSVDNELSVKFNYVRKKLCLKVT
jgi:hypothetical protein